jgi:argininosuccinate lyase
MGGSDMSGSESLARRDAFFWYCQMDKATTLAALDSGILTNEQAQHVANAIQEVIVRGDGEASGPNDQNDSSQPRPTDYLEVQAMLREAGGPETSRMHSGRSRQCMLATLHRCFLRDRFLMIFESLLDVRQQMLSLGITYAETLVPAYTNGVQAQPVTMGHLLCGYESALQRTSQRMIEAYNRLNQSPLGSAALATTRFPVNRDQLATLLGFDGCVENAFDAAQIAIVDVGAETAHHASLAALSLSTFIQDIHAQFHHARPWVLLDNSRPHGSSSQDTASHESSPQENHTPRSDGLLSPSTLMPQKRNPVVLNRARLAASKVLGASFTASLVGHNVNSGMTDYKRFDAAQTLEETKVLLNEVSDILDAFRVDEDAATAELAAEFSTTSELAGFLQERYNIAYAIGHSFASKLVDHARKERLTLRDLTEQTLQAIYRAAATEHGLEESDRPLDSQLDSPSVSPSISPLNCPLDRATFLEAIDPRRMVNKYRGLGGSHPDEVKRLLTKSKEEHSRHTAWFRETQTAFHQSETNLAEAFEKLRD